MFRPVFKAWVVFGWGLCCFAGERSVLLSPEAEPTPFLAGLGGLYKALGRPSGGAWRGLGEAPGMNLLGLQKGWLSKQRGRIASPQGWGTSFYGRPDRLLASGLPGLLRSPQLPVGLGALSPAGGL